MNTTSLKRCYLEKNLKRCYLGPVSTEMQNCSRLDKTEVPVLPSQMDPLTPSIQSMEQPIGEQENVKESVFHSFNGTT